MRWWKRRERRWQGPRWTRETNIIGVIIVVSVVFWLLLIGSAGYVCFHFVHKFW